MAQDDHAVVVGIRTYPAIRPLQGPFWDADEFRKWLLDPEKGNVPEDNIKFLTTDHFDDPDNTDHPNASEIHQLFKDFVIRGYMGGDPIGRRLYIYMAGHGFSERTDMTAAALYAAEADPPFAPNIAATAYARWFHRNATFDEIVLVMDCCRTTSPTNIITPPTLPSTMGSSRRAQVRTFFAYAVADGQPSRERQVNGKWRGIFTSAFLEALDRAVANEAGAVRGKQLADYIHQIVGRTQVPDIEVNYRHDVTFSVGRNPGSIPFTVRLDPFADGLKVLILNHQNEEILEESPAEPTFTIQLTAGLYKVVVNGTDRKALFEVPVETETTI